MQNYIYAAQAGLPSMQLHNFLRDRYGFDIKAYRMCESENFFYYTYITYGSIPSLSISRHLRFVGTTNWKWKSFSVWVGMGPYIIFIFFACCLLHSSVSYRMPGNHLLKSQLFLVLAGITTPYKNIRRKLSNPTTTHKILYTKPVNFFIILLYFCAKIMGRNVSRAFTDFGTIPVCFLNCPLSADSTVR